jgi:ketosteroid isomerase-like protein
MADTAQYVADRMALMDVMLKYGKACDERDIKLYRSVFADDALIEGFGAQTYQGADNWAAYVDKALDNYSATQHMMAPQYATVDGDTAQCRTDVQATHWFKDKPGTTLTLWATYETTMKRMGGEWKIARHRLVSRGRRTQAE